MSSVENKQLTLKELFYACDQVEQSLYRKGISQRQSDQSHNQNKIFLILGIMASGKTSLMYYLCGQELQFGVDEKKRLPFLIPSKQYRNAVVSKASNNITTRRPNIMAHDEPSSSENEQKRAVFVQIPDVKELEDEQKTCWYYFVSRLLKRCANVHLLMVLTQQVLDDGKSLLQNFQCITSLFNIEDQGVQQILKTNLSIIINKTDPKNDTVDIKQKLQDQNTDAIQEQNQPLFEIMNEIIREGRVYIVREEQSSKQQQTELFEEILGNSECNKFNQILVKFTQIKDLMQDDDGVGKMLEDMEIVDCWLDLCRDLYLLARYMSDSRNREANFEAVEPIINEHLRQIGGQQNMQDQGQRKNIQFSGNVLPDVKQSLTNLINLLNLSPQQSPLTINHIKRQLHQIKMACYSQLGIHLSHSAKQPQQPTNELNPTKELLTPTKELLTSIPEPSATPNHHNNLFYRILASKCNSICVLVQYLADVMDFQSQQTTKTTSHQREQHQFKKQCLIYIAQQLANKFKQEFRQFNMKWLNSKGKSRQVKKITVSYSIQNLKQQILTKFKSKPIEHLLNHIQALPNTHFKLYMFCLQLPQNLQSFIARNFLIFTEIMHEISDILKAGKLYFEQLKFLVLIPDWNKIEIVLDRLQTRDKGYLDDVPRRQHEMEFLNKLGMFAQQQKRIKLSKKIFAYVDSTLQKISTVNDYFAIYHNELTSLRQDSQIQEKSFHTYALHLYRPGFQGQLPAIVQQFKKQQETIGTYIEKINMFEHLISQKNI